jgi:hypothetical protein
MTPDQIKEVLKLHAAWLANKADGQRANLYGADLSSADLYGADLSSADLYGADLSSADLSNANLYGANLYGANLYGADLSNANLSDANLSNANLYGANLRSADLYNVDLRNADLRNADLSSATLRNAIAAELSIVPEVGQFTGWKKCNNNVLVQLVVGKNARRSNATGRKCRAEYVEVLDVIGAEVGISVYDNRTEYRVGKIVRCDKWESDRWVECGGGIHFFLTRLEAENYSQ